MKKLLFTLFLTIPLFGMQRDERMSLDFLLNPAKESTQNIHAVPQSAPDETVQQAMPHSHHTWTCSYPGCTYETMYRSNLARHMRAHSGGKPYHCDQCDYATAQQSNLVRHIRIHSDEKPYHCDQCDFATKWELSLAEHKKRMHKPAP